MPIIAHVDMDCFFAACEVKRNPTLAGKPVVIGATGKRGVVCTASYEARKFNVHSALPISIARQRLPNGIYLPVDGIYYRQQSKSVMHVLNSCAEGMQQISIDEAYLDVTHYTQIFPSPDIMGVFLQQLVKKKTGLSCSLGIASDRTVAKIASDYEKPAGITVVDNQEEFLAPLPLEKFPGIGKKSIQYYHNNKIYTFQDLTRTDRFRVLELFGMHGITVQQIALGERQDGLQQYGAAKSVSREQTFQTDKYDREEIRSSVKQLCHQVYKDLQGREFKRVSLKIRYQNFITKTHDKSLTFFSSSEFMLSHHITKLLQKCILTNPVRLIGVKVSRLYSDSTTQLTLL